MGHPEAFTIVEMIVVISIILVVLGLSLPAVKTLWDDRKSATALNTLQGLFMTTRAEAMRPNGVETGLFFLLDDQGTQKILTIAGQKKPVQLTDELDEPCNPQPTPGTFAYDNVFEILDSKPRDLPAPMRAVPQYVFRDARMGFDEWEYFDAEELANNSFESPSGPVDPAQQHRNFFTLVFDTTGRLTTARDVLIRDLDHDGDGRGDRTGLLVGPGPCPEDNQETTDFYDQQGQEQPIDPDQGEAVPSLIINPGIGNGLAFNFASVDGIMVYDDSTFSVLPGQTQDELEAKRDLLLRTARPMYISRWTGVVLQGPIGENVAPEP
ncbi:MAG: hypothetical protein PVI86_01375 [Phycisphaerae bacterium]|jgi:type II secretory pathway pseudopilin PulG